MEDESKIDEKKVQELAEWLKKNCHRYQRFYTATYFVADIDDSAEVAGVRLSISHGWGYVDILGLTDEEEQALEKLMEADDALKDDDEEDNGKSKDQR